MNSNSTITSFVGHVLFKPDYFTAISFNTIQVKSCGNKLITNVQCVDNITRKKGDTLRMQGLSIDPRFEIYHTSLDY